MVSLYLKAGVLTLMLFLLGMYSIKYFDEQRMAKLEGDLGDVSKDIQETKQLMLYMQVFGGENDTSLCPIIGKRMQRQMAKTYELATLMQQYQDANILSNYERVKENYLMANSELFLYSVQEKAICEREDIPTILFFYDDREKCEDCIVQGQILDDVRRECANARVFAFPAQSDLDVVQVLAARYNVTGAPSMVVNEEKMEGVVAGEEIIGKISCVRAA